MCDVACTASSSKQDSQRAKKKILWLIKTNLNLLIKGGGLSA